MYGIFSRDFHCRMCMFEGLHGSGMLGKSIWSGGSWIRDSRLGGSCQRFENAKPYWDYPIWRAYFFKRVGSTTIMSTCLHKIKNVRCRNAIDAVHTQLLQNIGREGVMFLEAVSRVESWNLIALQLLNEKGSRIVKDDERWIKFGNRSLFSYMKDDDNNNDQYLLGIQSPSEIGNGT